MRQRLKGLTSSGYLYRTQCHRHGTGCIHRKGQRIYRAYKLIERRSASHRIVEGERDANLPSENENSRSNESPRLSPRILAIGSSTCSIFAAFNRSVRIKKKEKRILAVIDFL